MRLHCTVVDIDESGHGGAIIASSDPDAVGPGASAPKVLILIEAARRIVDGSLDPNEPLDRRSTDAVGDSGLWQHLGTDSLSVIDACTLIAAVSDNLAANVLVDHLGLESINTTAAESGLAVTRWVDQVRDERDPVHHRASCSLATTAELARLMADLHRGTVIDAAVGRLALGWLDTGVDLSLGAEVFAADPLAHTPADLDRCEHRLRRLAVKTGADRGLLVEMGLAVHRDDGRAIAWATRAIFDPDNGAGRRIAVDAMRNVLRELR